MRAADLGEDRLIRRIAERFPAAAAGLLKLGIGDDAAILAPPAGTLLAMTSDLLLEDVHFRRSWAPPILLGHKALAVNLCDLAAMGARPRVFFLDLGIPAALPLADLDDFVAGLAAEAGAHGGVLLGGGDTCAAQQLHIGISLIGEAPASGLIRRQGARPGDRIAVTGPLGDAALGLRLLEAGWRIAGAADAVPPAPSAASSSPMLTASLPPDAAAQLLLRHLKPVPLLKEGQRLAGHVSAGMDLSDGLATDLPRLCRASGCSAELHLEKLPLSPALRACCQILGLDAPALALTGGEDYQLLVTVPEDHWGAVASLVPGLVDVGEILPAGKALSLLAGGRRQPWPEPSYRHFQGP